MGTSIFGTSKLTVVIGSALLTVACARVPIQPAPPSETAVRAKLAAANMQDAVVVDCQLPGSLRKLGGMRTYMTPGKLMRLPAVDCRSAGGDYEIADLSSGTLSIDRWKPLAEQGDAEAQYYVARIYANGMSGVAQDYAQAAGWYQRASAQNYKSATLELAYLYEQGLGVPQDRMRALNMQRAASGLGEDLDFASKITLAQADAAQQVAAMSERLEESNAALQDLRGQLVAMQDTLARNRAAMTRSEDAVLDLRAQLAAARRNAGASGADPARVEQLESALAAKEQSLAGSQDRIETLEHDLATAQSQLGERLASSQASSAQLARLLAASQAEAKSLRSQVAQTEQRLIGSQEELRQLRASYREEADRLTAQGEALEKLRRSADGGSALLAEKQRELDRQTLRVQVLERELAAAKQVQSSATSTADAARAAQEKIAALDAAAKAANSKATDAEGKATDANSKVAAANARATASDAKAAAAIQRAADSDARATAATQQVAAANQKAAGADAKATAANQKLAAATQQLAAANQKAATAEANVTAANAKAAAATERATASDTKLASANAQNTSLRTSVATLQARLDEQTRILQAQRAELASLQNKGQSDRTALVDSLTEKLRRSSLDMQEKQRRLASLESETAVLRTQYKLLQEQATKDQAIHANEVQGLRSALNMAQQRRTEDANELDRLRTESAKERYELMQQREELQRTLAAGQQKSEREIARLNLMIQERQDVLQAKEKLIASLQKQLEEPTPSAPPLYASVRMRSAAPTSVKFDPEAAKLLSLAQGSMQDTHRRYHALVIGNSNYAFMAPLATPINDARDVADVLRNNYGFDVKTLFDATSDEIMRELYGLGQTLTPDDNLLIYYAGHGDKGPSESAYWLGTEADNVTKKGWIPADYIRDQIKNMKARQIIVVADACFAGAMTHAKSLSVGRDVSEKRFQLQWNRRARMVLTSGQNTPVTDSGGSRDHSLFATYFIQILRQNVILMSGEMLSYELSGRIVPEARKIGVDEQPTYATLADANHDFGEFFFVPVPPKLAALTTR
jgi:chromosome segregation ATPase